MRSIARTLLLIVALICFIVAASGLPATIGGRPLLTWMAAGLACLTASLLVDRLRFRG